MGKDKTMTDSRRCPDCLQWISVGLRNQRRTFMRHIRENHPATYKKMLAAAEANLNGGDAPAWGTLEIEPVQSKVRERLLTAEEGAEYDKVRAQVETEFPPLRHSPSDGHKEGCKCPAHKNRTKVDGIWQR